MPRPPPRRHIAGHYPTQPGPVNHPQQPAPRARPCCAPRCAATSPQHRHHPQAGKPSAPRPRAVATVLRAPLRHRTAQHRPGSYRLPGCCATAATPPYHPQHRGTSTPPPLRRNHPNRQMPQPHPQRPPTLRHPRTNHHPRLTSRPGPPPPSHRHPHRRTRQLLPRLEHPAPLHSRPHRRPPRANSRRRRPSRRPHHPLPILQRQTHRPLAPTQIRPGLGAASRRTPRRTTPRRARPHSFSTPPPKCREIRRAFVAPGLRRLSR